MGGEVGSTAVGAVVLMSLDECHQNMEATKSTWFSGRELLGAYHTTLKCKVAISFSYSTRNKAALYRPRNAGRHMAWYIKCKSGLSRKLLSLPIQ
jgi:hypothetical protein